MWNTVFRTQQTNRAKFAFLTTLTTLQPQTTQIMLQTRYFFGFYYFYATA
jgi:hypothetical protein